MPPSDSESSSRDSGSDSDGEALDQYSDETKLVLQALKSVEKRQILLDSQYERERMGLEKKYAELQRPLYEHRDMLIRGKGDPTTAEIEEGENILKAEVAQYVAPSSKMKKNPGIPDFWLTVLQNSNDISFMISEGDEEILKGLLDVRFSYLSPSKSSPDPSFRISFYFSSKRFFQNTLLHKDYIYKAGSAEEEEWVFDHAEASTINWKGKDATQDTGDEGSPSFFNFFYPPVRPSPEELEAKNLDAEFLERLESLMEHDLEIGEALKDDIIPNALDLFIYGDEDDADEDEDDEGEDEDEDEDEGNEDDEDDEDNEDNEDEDADSDDRGSDSD